MKKIIYDRILWFIAFLLISNYLIARNLSVSPFDHGLNDAKNDIDRFWVLYNTHIAASKEGKVVDYSGINELNIQIPKGATSIPINGTCNFANTNLYVLNNEKNDFYLFQLVNKTRDIDVDKSLIDSGDFTSIQQLSKGDYILFITDSIPWVEERKGYTDKAIRKDVLLLHNGKAVNKVISPYDNNVSSPQCTFVATDKDVKIIAGLNFYRDSKCTCKTFLLRLAQQNNVVIENIAIATPPNDSLFGDHVFQIENCTNITFNNCTINGTYSQSRNFGYGFYLNNVHNASFANINTVTDWGVFCSKNVSNISLKKCNISRYDIHYYGKDVICKDCVFSNSTCSYTSVYGSIKYKRCVFNNCIPFHYDYSYDAYTPCTFVMKKCVVNVSDKRNYLIMGANLLENSKTNRRKELVKNSWPTIKLSNLTINVKSGFEEFYLYKFIFDEDHVDKLSLLSTMVRENLSIRKIKKDDNMAFNFSQSINIGIY